MSTIIKSKKVTDDFMAMSDIAFDFVNPSHFQSDFFSDSTNSIHSSMQHDSRTVPLSSEGVLHGRGHLQRSTRLRRRLRREQLLRLCRVAARADLEVPTLQVRAYELVKPEHFLLSSFDRF
jgi:hypothetical protein